MPIFGKRQSSQAPAAHSPSLLCVSGILEVADNPLALTRPMIGVIGFPNEFDRFCEMIADPRAFISLMSTTFPTPLGPLRSCRTLLVAKRYFSSRGFNSELPNFGLGTAISVTEQLVFPEYPAGTAGTMMISCDVVLSDDDAERIHAVVAGWPTGFHRLVLAFESEFFALPPPRPTTAPPDEKTFVAHVVPKLVEVRKVH
jgi:hypothetical protein